MNLSLGLSLDFFLFIGFLLLNLLVGLSVGRKTTTIRDFAIGNKDFSIGSISATIVATWASGGLIFYGLAGAYTTGLSFMIALWGTGLCLLFIGQVLAIRMGEFLNNISVAEAMGSLYGNKVRFITALIGIVAQMGYVIAQFQVLGRIISFFTGIDVSLVIIAAAFVVIIYSSFGGIRSVTITDIFQFITLCLFILLLLLVVWRDVKKSNNLSYSLSNNPLFGFKHLVGWNPTFISTLGLLLYFFMPGLDPTSFQRIVMAKDVIQAKKAFTYAAIPVFLIYTLVASLGLLLLADNPTLESNKLVNYIVEHYAYTGLKGLVVIGIAAMAMSTADSYLNSSAVLGIHDMMKVAFPKWEPTLTKVRLFSMFLGVCALYLSLRTTDILALMLKAGGLYMAVITVPLLFAIFGFRTTPKAVFIGMAAGMIALFTVGMNNLFPAMVVNAMFLVGSHYLLGQAGGWVGIKDEAPLLADNQKRKEWWCSLINNFKNISLAQYLEKNLPTHNSIYFFLGLYVAVFTYGLFFTLPQEVVLKYQSLYDVTIYSVLICVTGLLIYPALPSTFRFKRFITYAWPIVIGYTLFVVDTQVVLMSGFSVAKLMIMLCNLMLVAIFLSPSLTLVIPIMGILGGYLVFVFYYKAIPYDGVVSFIKFNLTYILLVVITFLLSIFRVKREKNKIGAAKEQLGLAYAGKKKELSQVIRYSQELAKEIEENPQLFDENALTYIRQVIYHIKDYVQLEVSKITLKKLISDINASVKVEPFEEIPALLVKNKTKQADISADVDKIKQLLFNAISLIHKSNKANKPIQIILEDTTLSYTVSYMKDYLKKIKALRITLTTADNLPLVNEIYPFNPISVDSHTTNEILFENIRIVDAHYGYAWVDGLDTHVYVIPIQVRDVRAKVMEILREPANVDPEELKHPYAIKVEKELWQKLEPTNIDKKVIEKALDTIKRYHAGVKRKSGEPFFTHPINVALILLTYCQDQDAIVAALLHDTVEDTRLSIASIKAIFGEQVAFIVQKVTNLEDRLHRLALMDHENVDRLTYYGDKRAMYVKLADRMHNMRTISGHTSIDKKHRIAEETLFFFFPAALHLGLIGVAEELKKCSLDVLANKK